MSLFRSSLDPIKTSLAISSFWISLVFFSIPAMIAGRNQQDLLNPWGFFGAFVVLGCLTLGLLCWLFSLKRARWTNQLSLCLLSWGICIFVFDTFFPIEMGPIQDGSEKSQLNLLASLLQFASFVSIIWIFRKVDCKKLAQVSVASAVVFAVTSLPQLLPGTETAQPTPPTQSEAIISPTKQTNPDFNIIHVVLDGFYGPWLEAAFQLNNLDSSTLSGFTHYRGARSNYPSTTVSFASFFSGTMYEGDETVDSWIKRSSADNLISDLRARGFSSQVFGVSPREAFAAAEKVEIAHSPPLRQVVDLWLMRISPLILRPLVYKNGRGPMARLLKVRGKEGQGDLLGFASRQQFLDLVENVLPRLTPSGHYLHLYFNPPHGPYELDRSGRFIGKSSYFEQTLLAANMIADLLAAIKKSGTFEKTWIVIQSDHGSKNGAKDKNHKIYSAAKTEPEPIGISNTETFDLMRMKSAALSASFRSLLLVKPPALCVSSKQNIAPLIENNDLVELLALRSYLVQGVDAKLRAGSCEYPRAQIVRLHNGLGYQRAARGKRLLKVGVDIKEGNFNEYRIRSDQKWLDPELRRFR